MEVHHSHHTGHKKKWTEFLLEFIMLFAAVSLGFLAENIREGQVEDHRAKEYLELFKNEVIRNNKTIDSVLKQNTPMLIGNERVVYGLLNNDKNLSLSKLADTLNLYTYRFSNDKRIFDQMKNSGALRYIKDQMLIDKITAYEIEADLAEFRAFDQETSQWKETFKFVCENMPSPFVLKMFVNKRMELINSVNPEIYKLYDMSKDEIERRLSTAKLSDVTKDKLMNYMILRTDLQKLSMANYKRVEKKGNQLIKDLEEYASTH
jgi:hypothetical protein